MVSLQSLLMVAAVAAAPQDTVLLDFTASWCGPCQTMRPIIHQLETAGYLVRELDVDTHRKWARRFRVQSVPCFVLVTGDQEVARISGPATYQQLTALFAKVPGTEPPQGTMTADIRPTQHRLTAAPTIRPPDLGGAFPQSSSPSARAAAPPTARPAAAPLANANPPAMSRNFPSAAPAQPSRPSAFSAQPPRPSGFQAQPRRPSAARVAGPAIAPQRGFGGSPSPAPQTGAAAAARVSVASSERRALHATVRIEVQDAAGISYATGTIIDVRGSEALALTCGHVFRASQGKGTVRVDTFYPQGPRKTPARVVAWEVESRDVGLISFQINAPVEPAPLAKQPYKRGDLVFSIGCDQGADPTLRHSRVTGVNRYVGAPNIETAGQPVVGRSGGGLFNDRGELIGLCNAADPTDDEGIYAALPAVQQHLTNNGFQYILQGGAARLAVNAPRPTRSPGSRSAANSAQPAPTFPNRPSTVASLNPVSLRAGDSRPEEVIVVVRSANGQGQVLTIPRPSPELLQQLQSEAANRPAPPRRRTASKSTVIRGQDRPLQLR